MKAADWAAYQRCPVCFRSWACVPVAFARRTLGARFDVYQQMPMIGRPARGKYRWQDFANYRQLSRPHRGRKRVES